MATATATVAAAVAKLVNVTRGVGSFPIPSSLPFIYSCCRFRAGIGSAVAVDASKPLSLVRMYRHGSVSPSFCTASDVNALASEISPVKGREDHENVEKNDTVKDAANMLDIRVGRIIKAWRHPEADSLYVEEVDVGEAEPRIICSGLVNYIPLHHLQDRSVLVLANLKPRNMRGVKSNGMVMAASDASHENVELLEPAEGSIPGERVWFGSEDDKVNQPDPATPNQIQKKKIWESVQPSLKTNDSCMAMLGEHLMRTSTGVVVCRSLKNAKIS